METGFLIIRIKQFELSAIGGQAMTFQTKMFLWDLFSS